MESNTININYTEKTEEVNIYPNPANNKVIFKLPGYDDNSEGSGTLYLWNSQGKLVQQESIAISPYETDYELDISHHPGGVYHVEIRLENRRISNAKLIIY